MDLQGVAHRRADVGEVTLHYRELGSGPLVVLLHGFPESSYCWRHQLRPLAEAGFRVVAPDLRGFGQSDKPSGLDAYRQERVAGDIAELIEALGAERAHVVGHDWGGVAAWYLAMLHPERVDRLAVLAAPHPAAMGKAMAHPGQVLRSSYILFFQLAWLPEAVLAARDFALLRWALAEAGRRANGALTEMELERTIDTLREPGALHAGLNYYRALARRPPPALRTVSGPTLMLLGERDPALRHDLMRPELRWVPQLEVEVLHDAGHFLPWEAPQTVNARLLRFLK